jgi:hypothetical protein
MIMVLVFKLDPHVFFGEGLDKTLTVWMNVAIGLIKSLCRMQRSQILTYLSFVLCHQDEGAQ